MVNQVMIEQLRDEMKDYTQDCEVYKDYERNTTYCISVIDFSPGEDH